MKKLVYFVLFVFTLNVAAQEQYTWNTDYKSALKLSKSQDKPILAFVVNQQQSEATELLSNEGLCIGPVFMISLYCRMT